MTPAAQERAENRREIVGWLQLVTLVVGIGALFFVTGQKDQQLETLATVSADLVEVVGDHSTSIKVHSEQINAIKARVQSIEHRSN